jgi:hypothetical protein
MKKNIVRSGVAALVLGAVLVSSMGLPAKADTTTNNLLYGAAAAIAAFTLYNVEHKQQLANAVEGYLSDGSTVYQDGRVVSRNGQTWYPGDNGQTVACSNQYCTINNNGNSTYGTSGYGNSGYGYNGSGNNGSRYNSGYTRTNATRYNNVAAAPYNSRRSTYSQPNTVSADRNSGRRDQRIHH